MSGFSKWSAVLLGWLLCGLAGQAAGKLSVSELNYRDVEDNDLEFIELINVGDASLTLTGAQFTSAIVYTFTAATTLAPGERLVLARDAAKFTARYGSTGIRLGSGSFTGRFADEGETVTVVSAASVPLLSFTYSPSGRWPSRPAGLGSTLECVDPTGNLDDPTNWRASSEWMGSPGQAGAGPQRVVAINEVLAHTDPPLEDAIELMNLTDQPVNLGGWYLSNTRSNPKKFRIPNGTILPARGFLVFYEQAGTGRAYGFNGSGTGNAPDFTLSAAYGDEVVLMSADSAGNLKFWMDTVSFEATINGASMGRYPDGTGDLTTLSKGSFGTLVTADLPAIYLSVFREGKGASNAIPQVGPIVFSRIQYHPLDGQDEYLELQNNWTQAVALYDPAYPTNTWRLRDGVDFDLPTGIILEAGARLMVVPIDPAVFRAKYSIAANIPIYGPWTNSLNNAGERVALYFPDAPQGPDRNDAGFVPYVVAEEVEYSPQAPWPTAADGTGAALVRKGLTLFAGDPTSWEAEILTPVEPPTLTIAPLPAGVRLSFLTELGRTYRLERQPALGGTWTDLGIVPATGAVVQVDLGSTPGFFRVVVE
ncbi:MAG: lamin tail domain-containing protein [Verrucomicrobia bacterium]|nr:lamin tail domain-containing protein [Verrucomicrobiota bacterium]